ncbi:hypothetical protein [Polystyrenella longa]|nr:hypothetical protein [Polystyrenella longa]
MRSKAKAAVTPPPLQLSDLNLSDLEDAPPQDVVNSDSYEDFQHNGADEFSDLETLPKSKKGRMRNNRVHREAYPDMQSSSKLTGFKNSGLRIFWGGGDDRYPNLNRFLTFLKSLAQILFCIYILAGIGAFVFSVILAYEATFLSEKLIAFVLGVIGFAFYVIVGRLTYVITMALMEFLKVIIDIESNTRQLAEA